MDHPRHDVTVRLTGTNGNAFAVIAKVRSALRDIGVPEEDVEDYVSEATSGDYSHLLSVTMEWVHVE